MVLVPHTAHGMYEVSWPREGRQIMLYRVHCVAAVIAVIESLSYDDEIKLYGDIHV